MKKCDYFLIIAQNIDCGYTLELEPTMYVLGQSNKILLPLQTPIQP